MTNPNAPYAAQPQQSGFQPQPQFQSNSPMFPGRSHPCVRSADC
ncbi:Uncharacterised protein [Bifidobacterium bifidum]|nr:Uncharacterised protein [Bifidobacterium bifidum]